MSEALVRVADHVVRAAEDTSRRGCGEGLETARGRANVREVLVLLGMDGVRVDDDGAVWAYSDGDWDDPSWV